MLLETVNTYSGGTVINGGTLDSATSAAGTALGTGNVTVNSGGTLAGVATDSFGYTPGQSPALITINGGTVTSGTNGSYRITLPAITFNGGGALSSGVGNAGDANGNFSIFAEGATTAEITVTNPGSTTALINAGAIGLQAPTVDFNVAAGSAASQLTVSSNLIGFQGGGQALTKSGNGTIDHLRKCLWTCIGDE